MAKDDDILDEARENYAACEDGWSQAKNEYLEDMRFARLGEQWPVEVQQTRKIDGRPCLTINRQPAFIRQVVNDGRQNRPSIKVRPVDSGADVKTAKVMEGLIRHIEASSDADVAYDTGLDNACSGGFGFIGVDTDYACDDSFDLEIKIVPYPNPLCVSWDPKTEAADSSDWRFAFVTEDMPKDEFKKQFPKAESEATDFASDNRINTWYDKDTVRVSKYFKREEIERKILLLSDGSIVDEKRYLDPDIKGMFDAAGIEVARERVAKSYEICIRLITGQDILDEKTWQGSIIPIVPVYGESLVIEGRRYFRSLIHDAMDSQRIHNYSRSTATELVSLAPKVPFIGEAGSFDVDLDKWANVNSKSYPFLQYKKGAQPPMRQPFTGIPEGAMNEAAAALEDMKQIIGIHDASLGIPGNEISGKAIRYRQHEGDVSTYHFIDNQHRAIRCVGRICLDLIPQVYSQSRIVRILGQDGKPSMAAIGRPQEIGGQMMPPQPPEGFNEVYDLAKGKYDLAVEAGPSYTTRREEAADMITTFIQAAPPTAPILGPMLAKMSDWPEADKVSELLATMMPPAARQIFDGTPMPPPGPPPELQAKQMEMQANMQLEQQKAGHQFQLQQQAGENKVKIEQIQAQADIAVMQQKAAAEIQIMRERAQVEAELKRQEAQLAAELKIMGAHQAAVATPAQIAQ